MREEFRRRLEHAGAVIPETKINLRPSFGVKLLRDPVARERVKAALEWFATVFLANSARAAHDEATARRDALEVL